MTRFPFILLSRLLFRKSRATIKETARFGFLGFATYASYEHMYPQSTAHQEQHENSRHSTDYTIAGNGAYPKLPDQRSIRLIKLYGAANPDDDVYVDLVTASIDKVPPYEALSYTWSSQLQDHVIYANGKKFFITKNAQDAIRQVRPKPGKFKYLWIDAICINQDDIVEKSLQVSIMPDIYEKATQVNIWLGNGTDLSDFIIQWYRLITLPLASVLWIERKAMCLHDSDIAPHNHPLLHICGVTIRVTQFIAMLLGIALASLPIFEDLKQKLIDAGTDIESRPYWKRVWTIQESNINPNCVILCGSSRPIHCETFYRALVISRALQLWSGETWDWTTYSIHLDHRQRIHIAGKAYHPSILRALCSKEATLEVDKIYAMRHKMPDAFGMITPDYSQTAAKVYTDAAISLLEAHHNVQFMRFACHRGRSDGLPTWVPAWTKDFNWPRWIFDINRFEKPLHPALVAKASPESTLKIKGLRIDTLTAKVSNVLPRISPREFALDYALEHYPSAPAAAALLSTWVRRLRSMSKGDLYVGRLFLMISRLIRGGEEPHNLYQSVKSFDYSQDGSYSIRANPDEIPRLEYNLVEILRATEEQCFFLTAGGQIGLSTAPVRKGDEIVLLTGESLPYIIRKRFSFRRPGRYTVVSPCFLSNGRKRKAWQEWDWEGRTKQLIEKADYENWEYVELV